MRAISVFDFFIDNDKVEIINIIIFSDIFLVLVQIPSQKKKMRKRKMMKRKTMKNQNHPIQNFFLPTF